MLMDVREALTRFNAWIDGKIAPPQRNRRTVYREWLADLEFERALHLGAGRDRHGLALQLSERGEVVALDPDTEALERNQTRERIAGDGQRLPIADDAFDLVFSEYVFEHLPDPEAALAEIDRILRPGGSFVVLVPNPNHYYARLADLTPFWFHRLWFRIQGVEDHEEDRYPTQYNWGTYADITGVEGWELANFASFSGPTSYTRILPVHVVFVLFDRAMVDRPGHHVAYVAHYRVPS